MGRAGWRAVFPNEKRELSAGCTEGRAGGLHKKAVRQAAAKAGRAAEKGSPSAALFRSPAYCVAHQPALMCRPLARPVVQLCRPAVL